MLYFKQMVILQDTEYGSHCVSDRREVTHVSVRISMDSGVDLLMGGGGRGSTGQNCELALVV